MRLDDIATLPDDLQEEIILMVCLMRLVASFSQESDCPLNTPNVQ